MPHLALGPLRAVLDLSEQLRLHPDATVCDSLGVALRLPDHRRQPLTQTAADIVEAVVDLAHVDQVLALAAADIAVPIVATEREARDGQRLGLGACLLDPVVAPAGPRPAAGADRSGDRREGIARGERLLELKPREDLRGNPQEIAAFLNRRSQPTTSGRFWRP